MKSDQTRPILFDPVTCGEDLVYNARRVMELVPKYCVDCGDYHLIHSLKRLALKGKIDNDRSRLFTHISKLFDARLRIQHPLFDIVIAGSVDTGLLATCAHAVFARGGAEQSQVRFTILDRCGTPLQLCRDYADHHGLRLTTHVVDVIASEASFPADIVLQHSLFNFLPFDQHEATLRKFARWLKPNGRIVFVNSTNPAAKKGHIESRRSRELGHLQKAIEAGLVQIDEPAASFYARLKHHLATRSAERKEFEHPELIRRLFAEVGMHVETFEEFVRHGEAVDMSSVRKCVLAILKPAEDERRAIPASA